MLALGIIGIWLWICLAAAVIPAIALLIYVYRQDWIEKEPAGLLMKLIGFGVLAALASAVIEGIGEWILDMFVDWRLSIYPVMMAFVVVAIAEEGMKFLFMKRNTWTHPAFNYRFDAIVYATFVSLGFAAFENIFYVISYGIGTALARALISVPGHFGFAVVMGYFYGRAKAAEQEGNADACERNLWLAFLMPLLLHGFFDALLMVENEYAGAIFIIFIIIFYVLVFRLLRKEARTDYAILNQATLNAQAAEAERREAMRTAFYGGAAGQPPYTQGGGQTAGGEYVRSEVVETRDDYSYDE